MKHREAAYADLLAEHGHEDLVGNFAPIPAERVKLVHGLIDASPIPAMLRTWEDGARKSRAGRKSLLTSTALITLFCILAMEESSLHVERAAVILNRRLKPESRKLLGVYGVDGTVDQWKYRAHRTFNRFIDPVDPKPGPRKITLTKEQVRAIEKSRDPKLAEERLDRLDWLTNEMANIIVSLAAPYMKGWKGNTTIDATAFGVYNKYGAPYGGANAPSEYDAAWYLRTAEHEVTRDFKKATKRIFGYETHLIVASSNHGDSTRDNFPYLIVGMSCSRPATDPSGYAMRAYKQVHHRHAERIKGSLSIGDRGYFASANPDKLQIPLKSMGVGIVTDFKKDQLGKKDAWEGAIQVEGNWYCLSMPVPLIEATLDYRVRKTIDKDEWQRRIAARTPYLVRRKERPDQDGAEPRICPAVGPNATVTCPLKALGQCSGILAPSKALMPILNPPAPADQHKICTNTSSVSFPATAGAKFAQELQFGTEKWTSMYGLARNIVETKNAQLKDESREGLASPGRRRVRGFAKQYFLVSVLVFTNNMRRLDEFLRDLRTPQPKPRRVPKNSALNHAPAVPDFMREVDEPAAQSPPQAA